MSKQRPAMKFPAAETIKPQFEYCFLRHSACGSVPKLRSHGFLFTTVAIRHHFAFANFRGL